ncbi:hypothetical protein [Candidatus Amarobacter glycogenicus]|uniref:hypothetical protein n=1 Tax=Candidatus Amarobacter glycogenicus TaxID=3140699 RepID=UPI00313507A8|nr:hypothetical protein [Dehalococcoidia bacterium]
MKLHPDEQALYDGIATLARQMIADQITAAAPLRGDDPLREAGSSAAATISTLRSLAGSGAPGALPGHTAAPDRAGRNRGRRGQGGRPAQAVDRSAG